MDEPFTPEIIESSRENFPISPLTPHKVEPKDGCLIGGSAGRTNTSSSRGKVIPHYLRRSGGKVIPHYLRASTGSCHDICKYGGHHAFEVKEKHPILKGRKIILKEDQSPIESVSLKTRKKMSMVKLTSCDRGTQSCGIPETKKQETKFKQSSASPTKKIKDGVKSSVEFKPKSVTKKSPPSPLSSPRDQSVRRSTDGKTSKKSDSSNTVQKKDLVSKIVTEKSPASPLNPHRDRSVIRDTNVKTDKKSDSPKAAQKKNLMPKRVTENSPPSPFNSPGDRHLRRDSDVKIGKNSESLKIGQKKELRPLKAALYPKPSFNRSTSVKARKCRVLKGVSPPKKASKGRNDECELPIDEQVPEKVLYVIEPKSENRSSELGLIGDESLVSSLSQSSPPSLIVHDDENRSSEYSETETDSEYSEMETDTEDDETGHQSHLDPSKENYRISRTSTVYTENNDPGHKLKFRRGRVVDPKSENDEPRRLKFRKGRGQGDNQNGKGEYRRKSFKKRESSDGTTPGKPEQGKVVLRHQDVDGKKDGRGLFNNVIEETASKLAETRKSKVKALVGAFETVISLQEKRPSTTSSG